MNKIIRHAILVAIIAFGGWGESVRAAGQEAQSETPAAPVPDWRFIPPENLLLIDTEKGRITIELNPEFAPRHVERMRELARTGALNGGASFYRVIDGFVAQAGLQDEDAIAEWPTLENENDRPYGGEGFVPLGNKDLFAPDVGHIGGFAVGRSELLGREWLLHCPGAVAMARDVDPDSGATEFYIVLDAQRYLDRNLTVFGRVIGGMERVQALKRGKREIENGVIQPPEAGDRIFTFRIAADIPALDRPQWQAMVSRSEAFSEFKHEKRVRNAPFFYRKPPEILDICSFSVPARLAGEG